jgi:hypothetical protein
VTIDATLKGSEGRQLISRLAASFGVDEKNASKATDELARALTARVERSMLSRGGVADVLSLVTNPPAAAKSDDLASQDVADAGNHILDVLIGNKHLSRGIAGRAASRAKINAGTVEKMLPVVAAFLIEHLGRKSRPALENLVRSVPGLSGAGGSPLPMPRGCRTKNGKNHRRSTFPQAAARRLHLQGPSTPDHRCRCLAMTSLGLGANSREALGQTRMIGCRRSYVAAAGRRPPTAIPCRRPYDPFWKACLETSAGSSER